MADPTQTPDPSKPGRATDIAIAQINERLARGDERMNRFASDLAANTAATERIEIGTAKLVSIMDDIESGAAIMCRIAKGVKTVMNWLQQAIETFWRYRYALLLIYFGIYFLIHGFTLPGWAVAVVANATGIVLAP